MPDPLLPGCFASTQLARTNFLLIKNYDPNLSNREAPDLGSKNSKEIRQQLGPPKSTWSNKPDPDRKLRIAYLSSDFRRHSVVHFITPVLEAHDRKHLQIHAYYTGRNHDKWTERVATAVDSFMLAGQMTDQELHQKIVSDRIDILVDLNGFTQHRSPGTTRSHAEIRSNGLPGFHPATRDKVPRDMA
jgi:predicted O-linked N-acetylglucosamine transferase (SPINDLY family)